MPPISARAPFARRASGSTASKNEIAGLARRQPDRLSADGPEHAGDRRRRGEQGPAGSRLAGDQGEDRSLIGIASYSATAGVSKRAASRDPVLVIAGPTASGKSALALELADSAGRHDHQRRQPADLSRSSHPDGAARRCGRERAHRTGSTAFSMPPSAARRRAGGRSRSARSPPRPRPAACRSWSAAPGSICGRSKQGLAPVPEIPAEIRQEAIELHRALGGAAFRERLAQLDPAAAAAAASRRQAAADPRFRGGAGDRRADRELAAPDRPATAPTAFATILLAPPRERLYAACDARFVRMIEAGALGEAAALADARLDPGSAGDEGGRPARTPVASARRNRRSTRRSPPRSAPPAATPSAR